MTNWKVEAGRALGVRILPPRRICSNSKEAWAVSAVSAVSAASAASRRRYRHTRPGLSAKVPTARALRERVLSPVCGPSMSQGRDCGMCSRTTAASWHRRRHRTPQAMTTTSSHGALGPPDQAERRRRASNPSSQNRDAVIRRPPQWAELPVLWRCSRGPLLRRGGPAAASRQAAWLCRSRWRWLAANLRVIPGGGLEIAGST